MYMLYEFNNRSSLMCYSVCTTCRVVVMNRPHSSSPTVAMCCFLQVGVVPDGVVSLIRHLVGKRCYTVITVVLRRIAVLIAKLLQMAVLVIYEVLV